MAWSSRSSKDSSWSGEASTSGHWDRRAGVKSTAFGATEFSRTRFGPKPPDWNTRSAL